MDLFYPTSRLRSKLEDISYNLGLRDPFTIMLVLILLLFLIFIHNIKIYLQYTYPGIVVSIAGLMIAGSSLLASGVPAFVVLRIIRRGVPYWKTVWILSIVGGLLASILTNDASLFVVVPLAVILTKSYGRRVDPRVIAIVVTGVNLLSALTPIGNPQNMIIAHVYSLRFLDFILIMSPLSLVGILILGGFSRLLIGSEVKSIYKILVYPKIRLRPLIAGLIGLVIIALGIELNKPLIGGAAGLLAILAIYPRGFLGLNIRVLLLIELMLVDFGVAGYLMKSYLASTLSSYNVYFYSIGVSQIISNVPATVLLVGKTHRWISLSYGVNVGGILTLWGSLANIIAQKLSGTSSLKFQCYLMIIGIPIVLAGYLLILLL